MIEGSCVNVKEEAMKSQDSNFSSLGPEIMESVRVTAKKRKNLVTDFVFDPGGLFTKDCYILSFDVVSETTVRSSEKMDRQANSISVNPSQYFNFVFDPDGKDPNLILCVNL
ncbi:hypothetical protein TSUD_250380 [Trifolium subterraneum]|nr:hypothetical protein TSUD_250380 [Trifolium subterraneum]